MSSDKLRILLADDHALVREGLKRLVNDEGDMEVVAEAGNGPDALRLAQVLKPDVALLDVSMPVWDGVKTAQMLRAACPQLKIISVTRHDDQSFVTKMFEAGAIGYVLKRSVVTELTGAIRAAARGERYVDPAIRLVVQSPTLSVPDPGQPESHTLSTLEQQVLRLVALAESNQRIAEELRIDADSASELKADAMQKAGLATRLQVIRYAVERGWIEQL